MSNYPNLEGQQTYQAYSQPSQPSQPQQSNGYYNSQPSNSNNMNQPMIPPQQPGTTYIIYNGKGRPPYLDNAQQRNRNHCLRCSWCCLITLGLVMFIVGISLRSAGINFSNNWNKTQCTATWITYGYDCLWRITDITNKCYGYTYSDDVGNSDCSAGRTKTCWVKDNCNDLTFSNIGKLKGVGNGLIGGGIPLLVIGLVLCCVSNRKYGAPICCCGNNNV